MKTLLDGACTVEDAKLYDYMRDLSHAENIFLEPSACAAFHGLVGLMRSEEGQKYIEDNGVEMLFGTTVGDLIVENGEIKGVKIKEAKYPIGPVNIAIITVFLRASKNSSSFKKSCK